MGQEESLNAQSAPEYSKQLRKLVRSRGFVPQQVFNAEEMSLFWKSLPSRTFRETDKNPESLEEAKDTKSLIFLCQCRKWQNDKAVAAL